MVATQENYTFGTIEFAEHYAILRMSKNSDLTQEIGIEINNILRDHYNSRDFILITYRQHYNAIDLKVYKTPTLKNMKGFAIVSQDPREIDRARNEQQLWSKSFVFFKNLEDATDWAESFFY